MIDFKVETDQFQEFTRKAVENLDVDDQLKVLRAFTLKFIGEVIPLTPVDTGQARAGWSAASGRLGGVKALATSIELTGGDHGEQEAGRRMSSYRETKRNGVAGIELVNGVPHIVYLELGSSDQAPSGFVRLTLREMASELTDDMRVELVKSLEKANAEARLATGLRQGSGPRSPLGPQAIRNR